MTDKEILLQLIKKKGRCQIPYELECTNCGLSTLCWTMDATDGSITDNLRTRYERAVERYVKVYGKDDELIEILI